MNPGLLRHLITLRAVTRTEDEGGGYTEAASDVATAWAAVEELAGSERLAELQTVMERPTRFTIRYRADVAGATEILHDGRTFNVRSVADQTGRREWLVIVADEVRG